MRQKLFAHMRWGAYNVIDLLLPDLRVGPQGREDKGEQKGQLTGEWGEEKERRERSEVLGCSVDTCLKAGTYYTKTESITSRTTSSGGGSSGDITVKKRITDAMQTGAKSFFTNVICRAIATANPTLQCSNTVIVDVGFDLKCPC